MVKKKSKKVTKRKSGCIQCGSKNIAKVSSDVSDMFCFQAKGIDYDGYVPKGLQVGDGDDLVFKYCLDCGQMQGKFPVDAQAIIKKMEEDEDDDY